MRGMFFTFVMLMGVFDPAHAGIFRTFAKDPLRLMTCEVFLKSELDQASTQGSVLNPLRDVMHRLSEETKTKIPSTTNAKNLEFAGPYSTLSEEQTLAIMGRLNGLHDELLNPSVDGQMVAFELRGSQNISKALDNVEAKEAELEAIYKAARIETGTRFSSLYTALLYNKWWLVNFFVFPLLASQDPVLAVSSAAGFHALLSPLYLLRRIYQNKRIDSLYASFKHFLRSMAAEPRSDQFAMSSASMTLPSGFHKYLFSDQTAPEGKKARADAVNLWGGSFIKFAKEWHQKGAPIADILKTTTLNAGDRSRNVHMDRIAYYDDQTNEPVWLFIYRSMRNTPSGRKPAPPKPTWVTEPEKGLVPIPVIAR